MTTASSGPALTLQQAVQLHQCGRLAEAEALYRRILAQQPSQADALHLLGLVAQQRGDPTSALAHIDEAIAVSDGVAEYHHNRGVVLLRLGRADEAEPSFRRALQLKPAYPDAHNALGNALQVLGRSEEAAAAYEAALAQRADFPEAHNNLGNALRRCNRPDAAIAHYQQALLERPDYVEALCGLAAALQDRGDLAAAEAAYRRALAYRPDSAAAWHGLASVQRELASFDDAIDSHRRAVAADPANLRYRLDLADALADFDRADQARTCFDEILARWPATTDAHVGLARLAHRAGTTATARAHLAAALAQDRDCLGALCARAEFEDTALDDAFHRQMTRLAEEDSRSLRDRSRLYFALARATEQTGATDDAFRHYVRGNELRRLELERMGRRFDLAAHAAFVDRQAAVFTAEFFARAASWGTRSELPVFIVGMPRSGTTLCEQILASHPQVHALGEQLDIQTMARELPVRLAQIPPAAPPYPECMVDLRPEVARPLVADYLARLRRLAPAAARVTDKHPTNFRHLGLIATLLPGARIIHCRRDPMDTCFSCFAQDFESPIPWAWDLTAVGQYYRQYDRLMRHWQAVLPVPVFTFAYEEAVQDLEAVARRLIAFCGLPWDARCLEFHRTERPVLTASRRQVRQPVYASSIGKWRRYERHLEPLRTALGDLAAAGDG
jgi:tetratricopeptide (TPR) repeat protein